MLTTLIGYIHGYQMLHKTPVEVVPFLHYRTYHVMYTTKTSTKRIYLIQYDYIYHIQVTQIVTTIPICVVLKKHFTGCQISNVPYLRVTIIMYSILSQLQVSEYIRYLSCTTQVVYLQSDKPHYVRNNYCDTLSCVLQHTQIK